MSDRSFVIAAIVLLTTIIPFFYYANLVYNWGHANKPVGYKYPEVKQLWMTGVGAVCFGVLREFLGCISNPIFRRLLTNNGDDHDFE